MAAKVRILELELESAPMQLRVRREPRVGVGAGGDGDGAVLHRAREETAVRHHAFLRQTLPPNDPLVREIERRRSGSGGDDDGHVDASSDASSLVDATEGD